MAVAQTPDRAGRQRQAMLPLKLRHDLGERDVWCLVDQRQDFRGMGLEPMRTLVAAAPLRLDRARAAPLLPPFDRRRWGDAEARRRGAARHAVVDRRHNAATQISGKRKSHRGWPPSPAPITNHKQPARGIPNDSMRLENALVQEA
jgi:hypothetical protein